MKTVIIGDTHGTNVWKEIVKKENADRVIFIGDYFDSFDIGAAEQMHNFKEIIEYKETSFTNDGTDDQHKTQVIMLIGNHDFHYYPGGESYSGYQHGAAPEIRRLLQENEHHMQMCYQMDNILCTHAGIGYDFLVHQNKYEEGTSIPDFINELWKYTPNRFRFYGIDQYGDSKTQTPIWIRPSSLMSGNRDTFLKEKYIQVVGHTQVRKIDIEGKHTGGKYYFIDAIPVGQYLIHDGENFSIGYVNLEKKSHEKDNYK